MRKTMLIRATALAVLTAGFGGAATAQEGVAPEAAVSDAPVAPWYQDYTQTGDRFDLSGLPLDEGGTTVDIETGHNWGVSLGFRSSTGVDRQESFDGVSAGAYFKLSPRMRVGGELGYRAREEDPAGLGAPDASSPQIKLESAFRF